eukprot:ANDGO_00723.mRNA.1 hypothetical protein
MSHGAAIARKRNTKFNVYKGKKPSSEVETKKKSVSYGPWVIGLIVFLVFGSAVVQILRTASIGSQSQAAEE